MSYLRYLCLFANSGVQHILCCVCVVVFFFVWCTLCCQFLWIVHFGTLELCKMIFIDYCMTFFILILLSARDLDISTEGFSPRDDISRGL